GHWLLEARAEAVVPGRHADGEGTENDGRADHILDRRKATTLGREAMQPRHEALPQVMRAGSPPGQRRAMVNPVGTAVPVGIFRSPPAEGLLRASRGFHAEPNERAHLRLTGK